MKSPYYVATVVNAYRRAYDHLIKCREEGIDYYVPEESVGPGELHRFFAYWRHKKDLLDALLKHQNSSLLTDRAIRFAMREEGSPVREFGTEKEKGSYEAIVFYLSGIFSLLLVWHAQGYDKSIDEMSALMMDILTNPAFTEPPC